MSDKDQEKKARYVNLMSPSGFLLVKAGPEGNEVLAQHGVEAIIQEGLVPTLLWNLACQQAEIVAQLRLINQRAAAASEKSPMDEIAQVIDQVDAILPGASAQIRRFLESAGRASS